MSYSAFRLIDFSFDLQWFAYKVVDNPYTINPFDKNYNSKVDISQDKVYINPSTFQGEINRSRGTSYGSEYFMDNISSIDSVEDIGFSIYDFRVCNTTDLEYLDFIIENLGLITNIEDSYFDIKIFFEGDDTEFDCPTLYYNKDRSNISSPERLYFNPKIIDSTIYSKFQANYNKSLTIQVTYKLISFNII